ncbi:IS3 family transposase [Polyangium spumosum]|uniref:IS3 family transposase n=1 Tax=Polyangium spumosum TaxID=889282 RepID=UPI003B832276
MPTQQNGRSQPPSHGTPAERSGWIRPRNYYNGPNNTARPRSALGRTRPSFRPSLPPPLPRFPRGSRPAILRPHRRKPYNPPSTSVVAPSPRAFSRPSKVELVDATRFPTRDAAMTSIGDYLERFYNHARRHSYLGYLSSCSRRCRARAAPTV